MWEFFLKCTLKFADFRFSFPYDLGLKTFLRTSLMSKNHTYHS